MQKDNQLQQVIGKISAINTDVILSGFGLQKIHPDEQYQWVHGIKSFSSSYERGWEANTLCGPPIVYPRWRYHWSLGSSP